MTAPVAARPRPAKTSRRKIATAAFDLCSGIGGFRVGALAATDFPIEMVGSCEVDAHSAQTYQAMFDVEREFYLDDLCSLTRHGKAELEKPLGRPERSRRIRDSLPSFGLLTA